MCISFVATCDFSFACYLTGGGGDGRMAERRRILYTPVVVFAQTVVLFRCVYKEEEVQRIDGVDDLVAHGHGEADEVDPIIFH